MLDAGADVSNARPRKLDAFFPFPFADLVLSATWMIVQALLNLLKRRPMSFWLPRTGDRLLIQASQTCTAVIVDSSNLGSFPSLSQARVQAWRLLPRRPLRAAYTELLPRLSFGYEWCLGLRHYLASQRMHSRRSAALKLVLESFT